MEYNITCSPCILVMQLIRLLFSKRRLSFSKVQNSFFQFHTVDKNGSILYKYLFNALIIKQLCAFALLLFANYFGKASLNFSVPESVMVFIFTANYLRETGCIILRLHHKLITDINQCCRLSKKKRDGTLECDDLADDDGIEDSDHQDLIATEYIDQVQSEVDAVVKGMEVDQWVVVMYDERWYPGYIKEVIMTFFYIFKIL